MTRQTRAERRRVQKARAAGTIPRPGLCPGLDGRGCPGGRRCYSLTTGGLCRRCWARTPEGLAYMAEAQRENRARYRAWVKAQSQARGERIY